MIRVNAKTGQITSLDDIRRALNASIPDDEDLTDQGYPTVIDDNYPVVAESEAATLGPPWNDNGTWRRSWITTAKPMDSAEINRHQAMIVLLRHSFLETVESMIANSTPEMKLAWKEAPRFRRNSPTLAAMASALHLSDAEVDALFAEAMAVDV
jgi:hypothetical protein